MMPHYSKTTKDNSAKVEIVEDAGQFVVNVYENIGGKFVAVDNEPSRFDAIKDAEDQAWTWYNYYAEI